MCTSCLCSRVHTNTLCMLNTFLWVSHHNNPVLLLLCLFTPSSHKHRSSSSFSPYKPIAFEDNELKSFSFKIHSNSLFLTGALWGGAGRVGLQATPAHRPLPSFIPHGPMVSGRFFYPMGLQVGPLRLHPPPQVSPPFSVHGECPP